MDISFGGFVADYRRRNGLSQEEFAGKIGISRNYLSLIECNKADNLTVVTLVKLANAMQIAPTELLRAQQGA